MKKSIKCLLLAISLGLAAQPLMYADSQLHKEIISLELELVKMKTKRGEYASMSEKELNKKIQKAEKELEKKRAEADKEAEAEMEKTKENLKKAGEDVKEAGKEFKDNFKKWLDS